MPRRIGKESTKVGKGSFHRGRKSFSSQLEKLLAKYEQRNMILQEKEATVRTRVEMMEAAMPVLLAWNMYQNCVEETESNDTQITTCPIWFSDQKCESTRAGSECDIQKRKDELDRLIREIRRREKLDRSNEETTKREETRENVRLVEEGGSFTSEESL